VVEQCQGLLKESCVAEIAAVKNWRKLNKHVKELLRDFEGPGKVRQHKNVVI
jgi:hypothetical protein